MAKKDFDEENVLAEMGEALVDENEIDEDDVEDLSISDSNWSHWGVGAIGVSVGQMDYTVVEDTDVAEELALAVVKQDLEENPEIFTQSWLMGYIDQAKLKEYVKEAAYDYDYVNEEAKNPEDFWKMAENYGLDAPDLTVDNVKDSDIDDLKDDAESDENHELAATCLIAMGEEVFDDNSYTSGKFIEDDEEEIGKAMRKLESKGMTQKKAKERCVEVLAEDYDVEIEPDHQDIDDLATAMAEDRAEYPESWFQDLYGDDAAKEMMDAVGIDIDEAAQGAVDEDGWAHFISHYDGNYYETDSGFVWWRD